MTVAYSYSEYNNLRAAQYADGTSSQYTYYSKHLLQKAKNPAGYGITYTYSGSGKAASVVEKAGTAQTAGRQIRFEYGWNVTNVIDAQNRIVTYQFNNAGQAVSIRNPEGEAVFMAYNSADRTKPSSLPSPKRRRLYSTCSKITGSIKRIRTIIGQNPQPPPCSRKPMLTRVIAA